MKLFIWLLLANFIIGIYSNRKLLSSKEEDVNEEVKEEPGLHPAEVGLRA